MARPVARWLVAAFVVGIVAAVIFDDESPPSAPDVAPAGDGAPPAPQLSYALDAARGNWPALGDAAPPPLPAGEQARVNYYIVLDGSGSMRRSECSGDASKMEAAMVALTTFVRDIPDDHNVGLAVFDGRGLSERTPLANHNRVAVAEQIAGVGAGGATPLHSAITLAFEQLTTQARRQLGYGEYHLVVVTDGNPQPDSEDPTGVVNRILRESPVLVHTIGFCIGTDHVLNQPGRVFYAAADSPEQLQQGLQSVLAEAPAFDVTAFGK